MENEQSPLFEFSIDTQASTELHAAAKRAKTVALISWFILGFCIVFFLILGATFLNGIQNFLPNELNGVLAAQSTKSILLLTLVVVVVIASLFVYLLYNFGNKVTNAITNQDQGALEAGFDSLRIYFMITGVVSFITLIFSLSNFLI
ncbi:MAG TPA: hypothetical protein PLW32_04790 [Chitinophagaceae bacterium]|nr:hypothetical protein [Chitinophagaceae bacterium]